MESKECLTHITNKSQANLASYSIDSSSETEIYELSIGSNSSLPNKLTINLIDWSDTDGSNSGGASLDIVKSVEGSVSGNDLTVSVNGVSSDPIVLPSSGGTGSGPTFTVLNNTLDTSTNNLAKFAEWVANAKVGDNIKIVGLFGGTGQFINTFDMSIVARDDDAKSLLLAGTGTARILSIAVGHEGYGIPITAMRIDLTYPSQPVFRGTVCYDTTGDNTLDVFMHFNLGTNDTYMLLTSY